MTMSHWLPLYEQGLMVQILFIYLSFDPRDQISGRHNHVRMVVTTRLHN